MIDKQNEKLSDTGIEDLDAFFDDGFTKPFLERLVKSIEDDYAKNQPRSMPYRGPHE